MSRPHVTGGNQPHGLAQPSFCTIAGDGIADPLCHGEPDARTIAVFGRAASPHFQPDGIARHPHTLPGREKIGTLAHDLIRSGRPGHRHRMRSHAACDAHRAIRLTVSCGPWHAGAPEPCDRRPLPCGHGIRGDVCEPGGRADRCVWSWDHTPRLAAFSFISSRALWAGCGNTNASPGTDTRTLIGLCSNRRIKSIGLVAPQGVVSARSFHRHDAITAP